MFYALLRAFQLLLKKKYSLYIKRNASHTLKSIKKRMATRETQSIIAATRIKNVAGSTANYAH